MVYQGPSRGCATCRKRRIKCDEGRPVCGNCLKRKHECPGYRDDFDIMLKDQTDSVPQRAKRKQAAKDKKRALERVQSHEGIVHEEALSESSSSPDSDSSSQALMISKMPVDHEMASLCFFFTNYAGTTDDLTVSRGFFEYMLPLYARASPYSALSLATSAAAVNISQMWMQRGPDTLLARSIFHKALAALKSAISDPVQAAADETLVAVLLLEFYESVGSRFQKNKDSSATHQSGALALVKHRGAANFRSETSKRLLIAVRSQIVAHAVQTKRTIDFDPEVWEDQADMPVSPGAKLDRLVAELANLQVQEAETFSRSPSPKTPLSLSSLSSGNAFLTQSLFNAALELDTRLSVWIEQLPQSWQPIEVSSPDLVHSSIFEAGVYGDTCHAYYSIHVAAIFSQYRCTRLAVLRIILKCCSVMGNEFMDGFKSTLEYARRQMQALVDAICDSSPFYLGNRVTYNPIDHTEGIYYPQMPMVRDDFATRDPLFQRAFNVARTKHARLAAALGGHFLLGTFLAVLRTVLDPDLNVATQGPILRDGQIKWIMKQLDRLRCIYRIPQPAKALP